MFTEILPAIVEAVFRAQDARWGLSGLKTQLLLRPILMLVLNVYPTPHGRIGGATLPVEGKK
jgi:hypothetical protein